MKSDKRAWWAGLKEKIGVGLERPARVISRAVEVDRKRAKEERRIVISERRRTAREQRLERVAAQAVVQRQAQEKFESKRAAAATAWQESWNARKLKERAGFFIGQRVRNTKTGRCGVILGIEDLSYCITHDDPNGARNFSLRVQFDNGAREDWNGSFWIALRKQTDA